MGQSEEDFDKNVVVKLICENPGCLDINIEIPCRNPVTSDFEFEREADSIEREINVEDIMNQLNLSIIDHQTNDHEGQKLNRPCKESDISVQVIMSNADDQQDILD